MTYNITHAVRQIKAISVNACADGFVRIGPAQRLEQNILEKLWGGMALAVPNSDGLCAGPWPGC